MRIKIDLLLVNPGNRFEQFASLNELATVAQPLGLAMIAAYVRAAGFSVAIMDAEAEFWTPDQTVQAIMDQYDPLIIGLSAFTTKMTAAGLILKGIKKNMPDVRTVLGGHHGSAIPRRTLLEEDVDFIIQGEGFVPMVELLKAVKAGDQTPEIKGLWYLHNEKVVGCGRADGVKNLDELPFAAWDLLPMHKYRCHHWQAWNYNLDQQGFAVLYTSLGCPFRCDYCSVNVVYGKRGTRYRSPANVVAELKMLVHTYKIKHVEIIDDTFTLNHKRVAMICDEIVRQGLGDRLNMWCFARTDRVEPELMRKMKLAGINWVFMGFESGDDAILTNVHKKQSVAQIEKAVDIVRQAGIYIGGNYVFGLPNDTHQTMLRTLDLAKRLNTEYANFFVTMAYPGTKLHDVALEKHYPLPEKWGQYGFFAPDALPMRNPYLSSEEILAFRDNAFKEYFGSEHYQTMIRKVFGQHIYDFLRQKVLSKNIARTRFVQTAH